MQPRVAARSAGRRLLLVIVALVALAAIGGTAMVAAGQDQLARVRASTDKFHTLQVAKDNGYGEFYMCTDHVTDGTMGQHYVNLDLVLDTGSDEAVIDPLRPEALVYEPKKNGGYKLVGVEYVVFQEGWDAAHDDPPVLFGQPFNLVEEPNRYGIPAFYELHAWAWKPNPTGAHEDWNPKVICASTEGHQH
jgi:hypothetical protein